MATTPTTKSQVQAYRFVLRRMESALVRKDAVMLHDPMGSHKRATVVGAIVACVGMIGFLVWGLFGGKGSVPEPGNVVIAKESGSVFVVTSDERADKRLIPMLNMTSAKLLVMAQGGAQGGGPIDPTTVKEAALSEIPRGSLTGMVNAPQYLPEGGDQAAPTWAICDEGQVRDTLDDSQVEGATDVRTTVVGGQQDHGTELRPDQALYVQDQSSGDRYLVYRVADGVPGQPHTRTVKALVDEDDSAVMDMYGLNGTTPRTISTNMLNAITEVSELSVPQLPTGGIDYMTGQYAAGDVVRRSVPGNPDEFFLLLPSGKQEISQGAAAAVHAAKYSSEELPNATGEITEAPEASDGDKLGALDSFPTQVPSPVSFQESDTSCLSSKNDRGDQDVTVTLNKGPISDSPVKLAQADGSGPNVDRFHLPTGKAAVVRGTSNEADADSGPIFLITDQGVQYGIKDVATARGLGVIGSAADIEPGPSWLMRSLPQGDFLDPAQASFTYDAVEPGEGVNRPPQEDGQGRGSQQQAG
ncbi:type VII secretion protein EccB [Bounagaea algeriensis]